MTFLRVKDGKVPSVFYSEGIPATFLITREGRIAASRDRISRLARTDVSSNSSKSSRARSDDEGVTDLLPSRAADGPPVRACLRWSRRADQREIGDDQQQLGHRQSKNQSYAAGEEARRRSSADVSQVNQDDSSGSPAGELPR